MANDEKRSPAVYTLELTEAERNIVIRIRMLKPFERISIFLREYKWGELVVEVSSTVREIFRA